MKFPRAKALTAVLLTATSLAGCATGPALPPGVTPEDARARSFGPIETVVILGLNDFHGALAALKARTAEGEVEPPVDYTAGGAAMLASHVRALRSLHGDRLLLLDAGDQYQGTIESNLEEGATVIRFFNGIGIGAAAVGLREFDFGQGAFRARLSEARYPYLSANLVDEATGQAPLIPNLGSRAILTAGTLKVGVVGLTTETKPAAARAEFVNGLRFTSLAEATLREAKALRAEGADLVVVLAHAGLGCRPAPRSSGFPKYEVRSAATPQGICADGDEIPRLLRKLPRGTVDAVVAGHTHKVVHHWIEGVPVIMGGASGLYYNVLHLAYDRANRRVIPEFGRIEGPVPVCEKVFEKTGDCNGRAQAGPEGRGPLVKPVVHGRTLKPDSDTVSLLEESLARNEAAKTRIVGSAARPIRHPRDAESELANLVADAIREKVDADVAIVNPGGLRQPIEAGPISYEQLFQALPFDNAVSRLRVTGRELRTILRVAQCGVRGFFGVSGARLKLIDMRFNAPSTDLNGDGKIAHWEINRLLDARLADDSRIRNERIYTLATVDFLVQGGDDMGWAMSQVPRERVELAAGGLLRDAVIDYLAKTGPVNDEARPLVDPARPRLIFKRSSTPSQDWNEGRI